MTRGELVWQPGVLVKGRRGTERGRKMKTKVKSTKQIEQ
jgi:hypothetical protein